MPSNAESHVPFSLRVSKEQKRRLTILSEVTGQTQSQLIRAAVGEVIAKYSSAEWVDEAVAAYKERIEANALELRQILDKTEPTPATE